MISIPAAWSIPVISGPLPSARSPRAPRSLTVMTTALIGISGFFLFGFGDDLLSDVRGHLLIMGELVGERSTPARHGAEIGGVFQYIGKGYLTLDDLVMTHRIHAQDLAAAAVKVADNIPHVLVGDLDHDIDDRFEKGRLAFEDALLETEGSGDLESHFRRIDGMVRAIGQGNAKINNRITGEDALSHGFDNTLLHGRTVLL